MFTNGGWLQACLGLPVDELEIYLMLFSFFLIVNAGLNRVLVAPSLEEDRKKALHDMLLIHSEEHLIMGLVNVSCLAYARANHRTIPSMQHQCAITPG